MMPRQNNHSPAVVLQSYLDEYQLNPTSLSKAIDLSQPTVRSLVLGNARINVSIALRLARFFNTTPNFWLDLQTACDLKEAAKDKELVSLIKSIPRVKKSLSTPEKPPPPAPAKPAKKSLAPVAQSVAAPIPPDPAPPEPRVPKKRGRKPKVYQPPEPVPEYKFVPRIILIKKSPAGEAAQQS
jgi:addiction module HigA family antidote